MLNRQNIAHILNHIISSFFTLSKFKIKKNGIINIGLSYPVLIKNRSIIKSVSNLPKTLAITTVNTVNVIIFLNAYA